MSTGDKHSWLLHLIPVKFWANPKYYQILSIIQMSILTIFFELILLSYQVDVTHAYSVYNGFAGVSFFFVLLSLLIFTPFLFVSKVIHPSSYSKVTSMMYFLFSGGILTTIVHNFFLLQTIDPDLRIPTSPGSSSYFRLFTRASIFFSVYFVLFIILVFFLSYFFIRYTSSKRKQLIIQQYNMLLKQPIEVKPPSMMTEVITQLRDVAVPITSLMSKLNAESEEEVFQSIQSALTKDDEYVTRLDAKFAVVQSVNYHCQLCKKELMEGSYWQCLQCQKYICQADYDQLTQVGQDSPSCLECGEILISLPGKCEGCGTYFLDSMQLKNRSTCPYCNNNVRLYSGGFLSNVNINNQKNVQSKNNQRRQHLDQKQYKY